MGQYTPIIRVFALAVAAFLFGLGIWFNTLAWGFDFKQEVQWVGFALAVVCTFMEVIWNHEASRANWTIIILGSICYVYGLIANFIGIQSLAADGASTPAGIGFSIFATILVELIPEPLFLFGLTGMWSGGDMIGQFLNLVTGKSRRPSVPTGQGGQIGQAIPFRQVHNPPQQQKKGQPHKGSPQGGGGAPNKHNPQFRGRQPSPEEIARYAEQRLQERLRDEGIE